MAVLKSPYAQLGQQIHDYLVAEYGHCREDEGGSVCNDLVAMMLEDRAPASSDPKRWRVCWDYSGFTEVSGPFDSMNEALDTLAELKRIGDDHAETCVLCANRDGSHEPFNNLRIEHFLENDWAVVPA